MFFYIVVESVALNVVGVSMRKINLIEFCLRSTCEPRTALHTNDSNCQLILLCFLCNGIAIMLNRVMLFSVRIESFQMRGLNNVNKQIVVLLRFFRFYSLFLVRSQQISRVDLFTDNNDLSTKSVLFHSNDVADVFLCC